MIERINRTIDELKDIMSIGYQNQYALPEETTEYYSVALAEFTNRETPSANIYLDELYFTDLEDATIAYDLISKIMELKTGDKFSEALIMLHYSGADFEGYTPFEDCEWLKMKHGLLQDLNPEENEVKI